MNHETKLLHKKLEREKNARQQADILLDQKSLQLWEANHQLQISLDEASNELRTINEQLSLTLKDTSSALSDNLTLLNEYKKAIDYSTIVSITDLDGMIIYVNDAFTKVSGYTREELIGQNHNIIRHPDNPSSIYELMWEKLISKKPWNGVLKNISKQGESYYVDTTITPILDKNGDIKKFLALRYNITRVIKQKERIDQQLTDRLTGLPNRTKLIEDIEKGKYMAITIFNIDAFQEINDLYGHKIGDKLLKSFGQYLFRHLNESNCYLYKLPADEFVIASKDSLNMKDLKKVISDLIKNFDKHLFVIRDNEIHVNVTVGMHYGADRNMLGNADIALKKAKRENLSLVIFDETMQEKERYASNQAMLKTLKDAIVNDRIIPYFQPIFSNTTMKIEKYETLMRMVDREGNIIAPFFFLEIAKKSRIYHKLTKIIIRKSFETFINQNIDFTINLSIEDIINPAMRTYIFHSLESFPKSRNVIFEITESEGINNYDIIKNFIEDVKTYGAQIAIDDFGSGYSNFMHLLELKVDYIKIDGSIIKNIIEDKNSQVLTKAILTVAKELNMKVIAEYVSTEAILNAVRAIGIDHSQGFYLGEPLPDTIP